MLKDISALFTVSVKPLFGLVRSSASGAAVGQRAQLFGSNDAVGPACHGRQ